MTKSSLIEELAVCVGQTMFSVHCTPLVSHDIILNCIKGIASTGIVHVHCCVYIIVHVQYMYDHCSTSVCSTGFYVERRMGAIHSL